MKRYNLNKVMKVLAEEQRTGTLICVSEDNVCGTIYVVDGKPRAARCRNFRGKEAMLVIDEKLVTALKFHNNLNMLKSESLTIDDEAPMFRERQIPTTDDMMEAEFKSVLDIASVAVSEDESRFSKIELTDEIRKIMATELVDFLGPVSEMVVSDLDDGLSVQDALNQITEEIGDMDSALDFISKIKSSI